jgi:hypothetical protein
MDFPTQYSENWSVYGETGDFVIRHNDGKFYEVVTGPYGNPVIYQRSGGKVYLTLVTDEKGEKFVLCEEETVYEDGVTPTKQWRAVRASLDNPNQPDLSAEIHYLGVGHSNTQRIWGPPDEFFLVELAVNPDRRKYRLLTFKELMRTKDNFGKAALAMYLVLLAD